MIVRRKWSSEQDECKRNSFTILSAAFYSPAEKFVSVFMIHAKLITNAPLGVRSSSRDPPFSPNDDLGRKLVGEFVSKRKLQFFSVY